MASSPMALDGLAVRKALLCSLGMDQEATASTASTAEAPLLATTKIRKRRLFVGGGGCQEG